MATQTKFKGAVYLTKAQYDTLASDGTITAGGVTLTYSPTDTLYITLDESASSITVDDALSATSENPVQNKAIAAKFETVVDLTSAQEISGEKTFSEGATFGNESEKTAIGPHGQIFHTVDGSGQSFEFPTDKSGTFALTSDLDDYATASDLEAEETTRTANDAALQTQIDAKQDALVSGTSIKTVNGESLLGSGDISISGTFTASTTEATVTLSVPSSQLSAIPSGEQLVMETNTGTVEWAGLPMGAIPISMSFEGAVSGLSLKLTYTASAFAAGKITEEYDDSGTKTITRVVQGAATATNNSSSSITLSSVSVKVTGTLTYVVLSV